MGLLVTFILLVVIFVLFILSGLEKQEREMALEEAVKNEHYCSLKDFKSKLKPEGKFYRIKVINSREFCDLAARLLYKKKHEWIILGFVKDNQCTLFWTNKGAKDEVFLQINQNAIITRCKEEGYDTVLMFHNHPGVDYFSSILFGMGSVEDHTIAKQLGGFLNSRGVNFASYVCIKGRSNLIHRSFL